MIKFISRNIIRFILIVLLQVFLFNNIQLGRLINPYVYVLFIMLLPFETPKWVLLVSAFVLGISIDAFSQTLGIHASATVFMAFLRPYTLSVIAPRDNYEPGTLPRLHYYGFRWFLKYTFVMVLAHHLFLFYIEMFSFNDFFLTLSRALLSSVFSITIIVLSQFFIYRR